MTLRRALPGAGLFLFILGLWLIARPYDGIWHDSVLYTAQALRWLHPQIYDHDLFFRYGSQDAFTVFSGFYAQAIRLWGVQPAAEILTLVGKLLWFSALAYACSAFLRGKAFWFGLAIVALASPYYGSFRFLSYGESFITNRLYAEALTLAVLGLFLRGRTVQASVVLAAALAVHPLIAIPGIGLMLSVAFFKGSSRTRRGLVLAMLVLVATTLVLAALKAPLFERLFRVYDDEWYSIIHVRNMMVFLENWSAGVFARMVLLGVLLVWLGRVGDAPVRSLARGALLTLMLLMLLAWLGADVLHDVLLTQLQLWRVLWLVQLLSLALLGEAVMLAVRGAPGRRWLVVLLCCALALNDLGSTLPAVVAAIAYGALWWPRLHWLRPRLAFVLGLLTLAAYGMIVWVLMQHWVDAGRPIWLPALANLVVACAGVAALLWWCARSPRAAVPLALVGSLVCALGLWAFQDRGTPRTMPDPQLAAALRPYIPEAATVYKIDGLAFDWLALQRAHYGDSRQGGGLLFSRSAALEAGRRYRRLQRLGLDDGDLYAPWLPASKLQRLAARPPTEAAGLRYLCDDPVLDFVILTDPVDPLTPVTASYAFETRSAQSGQRVRLYACERIRRIPGDDRSSPG